MIFIVLIPFHAIYSQTTQVVYIDIPAAAEMDTASSPLD
jgi:hypothetical protein